MNAHPEPDMLSGLNSTIAQAIAPHLNAQATIRRAQYVTALQRFDWRFEGSDDGRRWRAAKDELERLRAEQAVIDPSGELWSQYAPIEYHTHLLASA